MKKLTLLSLATLAILSIPSKVNAEGPDEHIYTPDYSTVIANPERGWHKRYNILTERNFAGTGGANGITLVHSYIALDSYKTTATLPSSLLNNLAAGLQAASGKGLKVILRPAYTQTSSVYNIALNIMLGHIQQINAVITANAKAVSHLEAGYVGPWGEWWGSNISTDVGGKMLQADAGARYSLIKKMLDTTPASIPVVLRYPAMLDEVLNYNGTPALTQSDRDRLGSHNDCFLFNAEDRGTYKRNYWKAGFNFPGNDPATIAAQKAIVLNMLQSNGGNKMMGGETCSGDPAKGDPIISRRNTSDGTSLNTSVLNDMRDLHFSELNIDFWSGDINFWKAKTVTAQDGFPSETVFNRISKRMGYRLSLEAAYWYDQSFSPGQEFYFFNFILSNKGYASVVKNYKVSLVFFKVGGPSYEIELLDSSTNNPVNPATWTSGMHLIEPAPVFLPSNMQLGTYSMGLRLVDRTDPSNNKLAIRLANTPDVYAWGNLLPIQFSWDAPRGVNVLTNNFVVQ